MNQKLKYMEIYNDIRSKIDSNFYKIDDMLPSGDDLANMYNCSKLTVKKGLDLLVKDGLLMRRRGHGTVVIRKPNINSPLTLGPNAGLINTAGENHITSKIHGFSIEKPSKEIMNKLNISENEYIYMVLRARYVDNNPYSLEYTYMPLSIIPGLEPKHLEKSIYNYIQNDLNLKIQASHVRIKGDRPNSVDIELLGVDPNSFLMEIEKTANLEDGRTFEYSITRHLYENFIFEAIFVQN